MTAHLISPAMGSHFSMYLAVLRANASISPPEPGMERYDMNTIWYDTIRYETNTSAVYNLAMCSCGCADCDVMHPSPL